MITRLLSLFVAIALTFSFATSAVVLDDSKTAKNDKAACCSETSKDKSECTDKAHASADNKQCDLASGEKAEAKSKSGCCPTDKAKTDTKVKKAVTPKSK